MSRIQAVRCGAAALLVALCLWAAGRAVYIGWASFQSIEARILVKGWTAQTIPFDQLAWNRAREGFVTAMQWDPDNPAYHEGFADLYLLRLRAVPVSLDSMRPFLQLALKHQFRAAALRPTWPYNHAAIAVSKFYLGEFDADFSRSILLASRYGPWEAEIQSRMVGIGYRSWAWLGAPERDAVRGNLVRAQQYRPAETQALLVTLKSVLPLCVDLALEIAGGCRPGVPAPVAPPSAVGGKVRQ